MKHIKKIAFLLVFSVSNIFGGAAYAIPSEDIGVLNSGAEFTVPSMSEEKTFTEDFSGYTDYITEEEAREALQSTPGEKFTPVNGYITVAQKDGTKWLMLRPDNSSPSNRAAFISNPDDPNTMLTNWKDAQALRVVPIGGNECFVKPELFDADGNAVDIRNITSISFDEILVGPNGIRLFLDENRAGGIQIGSPNTHTAVSVYDMSTKQTLAEGKNGCTWGALLHFEITVSGNTFACIVTNKANGKVALDFSQTIDGLSKRIRNCSIPFAFYAGKWGYSYKSGDIQYYDNVNVTYKKSIVSGYDVDNAVYVNNCGAVQGGTAALMENAPVRLVYLPNCASQAMTIEMSKDGKDYDAFDAEFDSEGRWINAASGDSYSYVRFPDGIDLGNMLILTEASDNLTVRIPVGGKVKIYPVIGGVYRNPEMKADSDNAETASYSDYEIEVMKVDEAAAIDFYTEAAPDEKVSVNVKGVDELEYAEMSGRTNEFIEEKKPIIDAVNTAISSADAQALETVICGTGDATLEKMPCVDRSEALRLKSEDPTAFDAYISRLLTYKAFDIKTLKDVEAMREVLYAELAVGKVCGLTDADAVCGVLESENAHFKLPLDNKYYTGDKTNVANRLAKKDFKNLSDLQRSFAEAYVMNAFSSADTFKSVGVIVKECADEIGYDKAKYDEIKSKTDFEQYLKRNQSGISTIDVLKNYIMPTE